MVKPKTGDKVKFKDDLWWEKRNLGIDGGLFGPPMNPEHINEFLIIMVNNQGDDENPDYELGLTDYPWLVYFDEMEIIE